MNNIKNLLNLVELIKNKYNQTSDLNTNFNIFSVLRNDRDEVNLHSKFIVELLYKIPHYSEIFLDLFLDSIGVEPNYFSENPKIYKEYKNIDILIKSELQNIIIENKIDAKDQPKQLERYYKEVKRNGNHVKIFYLTLDGHDPSQNSLGDLLCTESNPIEGKEEVINISYKDNISSWIESCIKEAARVPELRETLIQYLQVVNRLTGQSESKEYYEEVAELLKKEPQNLKLARDISFSYDRAINHLKLNFWDELENTMKTHDLFMDLKQKYSKDKNEKYTFKKIEKNKAFYGLIYSLYSLSSHEDLVLMIEKNINIYWGFGIIRNDKRGAYCNEKKYEKLKEIIKETFIDYQIPLEYKSYPWWFSSTNFIPYFNYKNPDSTFLDLANPKDRENVIKENVNHMFFISKVILNKLKESNFRVGE